MHVVSIFSLKVCYVFIMQIGCQTDCIELWLIGTVHTSLLTYFVIFILQGLLRPPLRGCHTVFSFKSCVLNDCSMSEFD